MAGEGKRVIKCSKFSSEWWILDNSHWIYLKLIVFYYSLLIRCKIICFGCIAGHQTQKRYNLFSLVHVVKNHCLDLSLNLALILYCFLSLLSLLFYHFLSKLWMFSCHFLSPPFFRRRDCILFRCCPSVCRSAGHILCRGHTYTIIKSGIQINYNNI